MATTATRPARTTARRSVAATIARRIPGLVRVPVGLLFFVTGLNGFLFFLPQPETAMPEGAMAFTIALAQSGFMMPLVAGVELVAGLLLVVKRFVPLALAILAPIIVGIVAFHVFLEPSGTVLGLVVAAAEVYLAWTYREAFKPMLRAVA